MKVLIVGGSGYLGRRMAELLLRRGDEVTVASRGRLQPDVIRQARTVVVDRQDRGTFEQAFRDHNFDAVIDNIAYTREDVDSAVRALQGRTGQYVFTSTMAVYRDTEGARPLRESDADLNWVPRPGEATRSALHPTQGHAYGTGKRQAELALIEQNAFNWTVIRPPIIVAPDDRTRRVWWFVQRILDGGPILVPDWGPRRVFQVAYADDLAETYVAALGNPGAYGKAYNVAQPEIFGPETWIDALSAALGRDSRCVRVGEEAIQQAGLAGYDMPIAGRPFGNYLVELSAAYADLDFRPSPMETWVGATARGCAANPPATDSTGYQERKQEIGLAQGFRAVYEQAVNAWIGDSARLQS